MDWMFTVARYWQYADGMTVVLDEWPEPDTETVAQRLRMHMGDKKITRSRLALASGIKRSALSNKLDGRSEFSIGEVVAIAHALNRSWLWVLTGQLEAPPPGDEGASEPPGGIEPPTFSLQANRNRGNAAPTHRPVTPLRRAS